MVCWGEAQQIFNVMENFGSFPSVVTFNALINGLCKAGKLEEAHLMLYKMEIGRNLSLFLRLSQGADRVLDSASLQKMVEKLVDSGLLLKAYKLLTQLSDSGVVSDIKTYNNTLIDCICMCKADGAFKLFEELQLKGYSPDSVTYATLIEGLLRLDKEGDAFKLFEQMIENGCKPSSVVYKTLMTWSCRRNKISAAFHLWFEYLASLADRKDEAFKSFEECIEKGGFENTLRGLLEMEVKLSDFDSEPYNFWLMGLCQASRIKEALSVFSILKEFGGVVSAPGCVMLIHSLCSEIKLDVAIEIFLYFIEKGHQLKPRICNRLLQILFSNNKATDVLELLDKMRSATYDLNSNLYQHTKSLVHLHRSTKDMKNKPPG